MEQLGACGDRTGVRGFDVVDPEAQSGRAVEVAHFQVTAFNRTGSPMPRSCSTLPMVRAVADIDAVVFDIGGVLLDWNPRHLYEQLIDDPAELDWFLSEVCTLEWHAAFDAGRSIEQGCAELAAKHPEHRELILAWARQDDMIRGEIEGTAAVVERLRRSDLRLYLLTNMPVADFERRSERFTVLQQFDGAVVSGREGVNKPDPRIFERLVERYGLVAERTVFVDDSLPNVTAAAELGFVGHHFTGATELEAFLDELGL